MINETYRVAWSYVALYVQECLCHLSARPKGAYGGAETEKPQIVELIANAEAAGVTPKDYVRGIVDQLKFEGRPPVHCLSICGQTGIELYRRYRMRTTRESAIESNTIKAEQERNLRDQVLIEIKVARKTIESVYRSLSTKPFDAHWHFILREKRADARLRHLDASCNIPAVFKYLAGDVWQCHGRTCPTVGEEYLDVLADPEVVERFDRAFPVGVKQCVACAG